MLLPHIWVMVDQDLEEYRISFLIFLERERC